MFEKLENEILNTYIEVNKIKFKKGKFDLSEITHDVNGILYKCLTSYYFEDKLNLKFVKTKINNDEYYLTVGINSKFDSDFMIKLPIKDNDIRNKVIKYFESKNIGGFQKLSLDDSLKNNLIHLDYEEAKDILGEIPISLYPQYIDAFNFIYNSYEGNDNPRFPVKSPYFEDKEIATFNINEKTEKTINSLLKIPEFEVLLTNDPVKKMLYLKSKNNFDFKTIDIDDSKMKLGDYIKFDYEYNVNKVMKRIYKMKYLSQSSDSNYKVIIAHNNFEIAGNLAIIDGSKYHDVKPNLCSYVSHIEVGEHFYGNKLGLRLMEKAIDYAKENNQILFRTSSSKLGQLYIKDSITEMGIKSDILLISEPERNIIVNVITKLKDEPKDKIIDAVRKTLEYIRKNLNEKDLEYSFRNKEIIEMFTTVDKKSSNKLKM